MGHGTIGFEDAFAQSCNSFFIKLGQQTGADEIVEMAEKLGLGRKAIEMCIRDRRQGDRKSFQ